ncbi:MAG: hypothetical protein IIC90_10300 [Chloroflexi bacterium]|nr:hypothetical protein [Chloroflexota bacterium]
MPESTARPPTDLASLLRPGSIAVVGASANPDSPGHDYRRGCDLRDPEHVVGADDMIR